MRDWRNFPEVLLSLMSGSTEVEVKERKDEVDDALNAPEPLLKKVLFLGWYCTTLLKNLLKV